MKILLTLSITLTTLITASISALATPYPSVTSANDLIVLPSEHFTILYNCEKRGFEHYFYKTQPDTGNAKRKSQFFQDKRLPNHCKQFSTYSYKNNQEPKFDRGHGTPANHFDFDKTVSDSTNTMANIVPHERTLNRTGLWRHTDKIVECLRDKDTLQVYGGVVWGNDTSNDYFVKSHGVITPDHLYKIIVKSDGQYNAWVMPNTNEAKAWNGDKFLVSVAKIEQMTNATFDIQNKNSVSKKMFSLTKKCDLS